MGQYIAGVALSPQITRLPSFFEIGRYRALISVINKISFEVTGVVSQFPTLPHFLLSKNGVSQSRISRAQKTVCHRKLRIEENRTLKQVQSCARTLGRNRCPPR